MSIQRSVSILTLLALAVLLAAGCMPPSQESLNNEVSYVRQKAYDEWKASRERGETKEPKLNGPLSIEDAVKLALRYNKQLQIEVQNREVARGMQKSSWGVILPSANLTSGLTLTEKGSPESYDKYSFGLTVTQPVWQGKAIPATLRYYALNSALVDEGIRLYVQNLVQQVSVLYYEILLHQHLLETHKEALNSAEAQLRMVSEKRKQETATDYEVLTAQVDVATYRAKMISEQNAIDTARVQLLKVLGCSQDSVFTLVNKLLFLPMRPIFERAVQVATCNRADLRAAELDVRREMESVRIAESAFFPHVFATLSESWGATFRGSDHSFRRNDVTAALNMSYSLGIENWGDLQSARAKQIQKEIALLDAQDEALREIRTEMNNLSNAEEMVNALVVNQDAAREALRLVSVGYQAGVKTEVDVTTARKQLTEVQGQYYSSLYDHTVARVALQVSMGLLGPCYVTDGAQVAPNITIADIDEFKAHDYVPPQPFVSPSAGKKEERAPRTRRRTTTAGRDVKGNIRDLRSRDFGADDEDGVEEGKNGSGNNGNNGEAASRTTLRDRLTGSDIADDERHLSPGDRAKSFSEREADRDRLQRDRQRARDERLNRLNQSQGQPQTRSGSSSAASGNGKENGGGSAARVQEARQKGVDIAQEAKQELDQLQRTTGTTSGNMKEAVRQAEEAIQGARDAVRGDSLNPAAQ